MIRLKPSFRIGIAHDALFLMNDFTVHRLPLDYEILTYKVSQGLSDPSSLSELELIQLENLSTLKVVYQEPTQNVDLCNFFETINYKSTYVNEQLLHNKVRVVNCHPDLTSYLSLVKVLKDYKVLAETEETPTLNIYLVDVASKLDKVDYPALIVKAGSYRPTVGPLLSPMRLSLEDFNAHILKGKACFENEGFQIQLPPHLVMIHDAMIAHEVLSFVIKAGLHEASGAIVDWDITLMRRSIWPI